PLLRRRDWFPSAVSPDTRRDRRHLCESLPAFWPPWLRWQLPAAAEAPAAGRSARGRDPRATASATRFRPSSRFLWVAAPAVVTRWVRAVRSGATDRVVVAGGAVRGVRRIIVRCIDHLCTFFVK